MINQKFHKMERSLGLALILLVYGFQHANAQTFCTKSGTDQITGVKDGYRYELWNQNAKGTACMTIGSGSLFSGEWSNVENYLARRGFGYDKTQQHEEIGTFYAKYDCDYNPSSASGNSYLSIYGWTIEPLIEFYIIEDWQNWIPSMAAGAKLIGTISANDGIYDIYENTRVNQPSIVGNTTFQQYFSIRQKKRESGTINISEHFSKWEELGLDMGKMYEVSFVVEGYQSSGNFNFSNLEMIVSDEPLGAKEIPSAPATFKIIPNTPDGNLSIELDQSYINSTVTISDTAGNVVYNKENINTKLLNVSNLKSGIYLLNVKSNNRNYNSKVAVY